MRTGPAMGSFRAGSFPIPDGGAGDGTACGSARTDSTTCRHQGEAAGPLRTGKRGKLLQCYGHLDLGRSGDLAPTFEEIDLSTGGHRDSARRGTRFEDRRDEQVRTEEILVPAMPLAPMVRPSLERVLPSRRSRRIAATSPLGRTRATRNPNAPEPLYSMTAASPC